MRWPTSNPYPRPTHYSAPVKLNCWLRLSSGPSLARTWSLAFSDGFEKDATRTNVSRSEWSISKVVLKYPSSELLSRRLPFTLEDRAFPKFDEAGVLSTDEYTSREKYDYCNCTRSTYTVTANDSLTCEQFAI